MRVIFVIVGLVGLLAADLAGSDIFSELNASDAAKVKAGSQVVIEESIAGLPWPRATVYQTMKATPSEVMAVFVDYENARAFVPNCTKSKISQRVSRNVHDVDYEISVPILSDEVYTARNKLSGKSCTQLTVDWEVLRASSIKSSVGNFTVEPFGEGSVVRYRNLVEPSSAAAGLLKAIAVGQMRDTVKAIEAEVVEQQQDPVRMNLLVTELKTALGE